MTELERKLAELPRMKPAQLRALWRETWRRPAPGFGADLLRRGIAWKMQARVYGELPSHIKRELERVADRLRRREDPRGNAAPTLRPGTRLVRQWGGKIHYVLVRDEGFEYDSRQFNSLTQVASAITGTHWSGPSFFGLKKRESAKAAQG
jgi:hypothetical protein